MSAYIFSAAAATNVGKVRSNNEDNLFFDGKVLSSSENVQSRSFVIERFSVPKAFAVFDGMGGEKYGEKASELAAKAFKSIFKKISPKDSRDAILVRLNKFYTASNKSLSKFIKKRKVSSGTTAVILLLHSDGIVISNIGDSKAFRITSDKIEQVTEDHTIAETMVRAGAMSAEEAKNSKGAHALTRYIGADEEEYDCQPFICSDIEIEHNVWYLLCSDGLTDMLEPEEIKNIILKESRIESKVNELISCAMRNGGKDNCTLILLSIQ